MRQRYLPLIVLAIFAVFGSAGCGILNPQQPTPVPFATYTVQDVINAFAHAGLPVQNPEKNMTVSGRGAPSGFNDRYTFEVPRVAPVGGQIIVFASADQLQAWQAYIDKLRSDSSTRRDVVYVYVNKNVLLQLDPLLTNDEASAYRDALMGMS